MKLGADTLELARAIRRSSLNMVYRARASHIGSALSICDIVSVLYGNILHVDPLRPKWSERDRFILSKGHACVAVYAALSELGFIPSNALETYGADHSPLMNHISHKVPGVEFSTGSLGHGLPFGVGKAFAAKKLSKNWKTYVLLSDGELDEGSNWEAMLYASHHKLDNIVAIVDYNKLQSLTSPSNTLGLEPLVDKFKSFGWRVRHVDGHNHDDLRDALSWSGTAQGKPTIVLADTVKGKGVSFMEHKVEWHYRSPDSHELELALSELDGK